MADEAHLRALLLQGLAGDDAAHRAFLTEAAGLLRAYFRNRLRGQAEDAEDLVQETLVALHTRRDTYDPNYPLTAWMYAIARYRLIDFTARRQANAPRPRWMACRSTTRTSLAEESSAERSRGAAGRDGAARISYRPNSKEPRSAL